MNEFKPFTDFERSGNKEYEKIGFELIKNGEVGCLLLSGGQGTRLGFSGPKGCYPISVIKNRSLFQMCAERVVAVSRQVERPLLFAIMTSSQNHEEIKKYFLEHSYFGLDPAQVSFFPQEDLPFIDSDGNNFCDYPGHVAVAPDGNGRVFDHFFRSGIGAKWVERGVNYINVIPIDNPLADPFDSTLVGFHSRKKNEITLKCSEKTSEDEKVGLVVKQEDHLRIVEYSEIDETAKRERDFSGKLKFCCANLGLYCFSMDFVQKWVQKKEHLPTHLAWKAVPIKDDKGAIFYPTEPNAWKQETFIFDLLQYTEKASALLYPRFTCFAPLKNASGSDSPEIVKEMLQNYDLYTLEKIIGKKEVRLPIELAPDFYYPTSDFLAHWNDFKGIFSGYLDHE
jgi:UDP-N-acetylglucosamine/UDP-N-acetylgalactosamine diphosphorylase